jgi:hypothetical protein
MGGLTNQFVTLHSTTDGFRAIRFLHLCGNLAILAVEGHCGVLKLVNFHAYFTSR